MTLTHRARNVMYRSANPVSKISWCPPSTGDLPGHGNASDVGRVNCGWDTDRWVPIVSAGCDLTLPQVLPIVDGDGDDPLTEMVVCFRCLRG